MSSVLQLKPDEETQNGLMNLIAKQVSNMLADTIKKIVKQVFSEEYQHDELLDKKTLAKEVLHCDPGSVDELFATQHGFPYMLKGSRIVYSRKAVEKWIADNQRYF